MTTNEWVVAKQKRKMNQERKEANWKEKKRDEKADTKENSTTTSSQKNG